jgi:hypothetical protein
MEENSSLAELEVATASASTSFSHDEEEEQIVKEKQWNIKM